MQICPAELADVNRCYQMNKTYTTDYVWQMQARENGRTTEVRFDSVRLPRSMRVEYPRAPDELIEHWQREHCFLVIRTPEEHIAGFIDAQARPWQNLLWVTNLAVEHRYRRQGWGTRLLNSAIRWALDRDLDKLTLELQTKNYPGICFAQKHGFQFCGYNEHYYPTGDIALFFSRHL